MSLTVCSSQSHPGAGGSNPGDMDAFKRQQAMVQGRARTADSCVSYVALFPPPPVRFLFLFVLFLFSLLIASAFRHLASSTSALCRGILT